MKSVMRKSNQRDLMRELHRRYRGDRDLVVRHYARAEREGIVTRRSNSRGITPDEYASRLFADGIKKGWLND